MFKKCSVSIHRERCPSVDFPDGVFIQIRLQFCSFPLSQLAERGPKQDVSSKVKICLVSIIEDLSPFACTKWLLLNEFLYEFFAKLSEVATKRQPN